MDQILTFWGGYQYRGAETVARTWYNDPQNSTAEKVTMDFPLGIDINSSVDEWTNLSYNDVYEDERGFAVLRGTNMTAVITETGYMSSDDFEYMINHTKEIAYGIFKGIKQYFEDKVD